jgi:hypothetical protein
MNTKKIKYLLRDISSNTTSRAILSKPVISLTILISIILHLASSPGLGGQNLLVRIFISGASMLPLFILVAIAQLLPLSSSVMKSTFLLVLILLGSGIRGGLISFVLLKYFPNQSWGYRIPSSIFIMSITVCLLTIGWESHLRRSQFVQEIEAENAQLKTMLLKIESESKFEFELSASEMISGVIKELEQIQTTTTRNQAVAIEQLVQGQLRPLSHELSKEIGEWNPEIFTPKKQSFREAWSTQDLGQNLPKWWAAVPAGISTLSVAYYFLDLKLALAVFFICTSILAVHLAWTEKFTLKFIDRWVVPVREIFLALLFETAGLIIAVAIWLLLRNTDHPHIFTFSAIIGIPIYLWLITFANTFRNEAHRRAQNLISVRENFGWAIARVGVLSWYQKGALSRLLHGPIQNALLAVGFRIVNQLPGMKVNDLVTQLRLRLEKLNLDVSTNAGSMNSLKNQLNDTVELWESIAKIVVVISNETLVQVGRDRPASAIISDLCSEMTSNAIRHGAASDIKIEVLSQDHVAIVRIYDNGCDFSTIGKEGVGTKMLDACTINWARTRSNNRNELQALIPLG